MTAKPPTTAFEQWPLHRSFVGQPQRYDLAAGSQFALLFLLGLREHHRLLDFGCGSLRLGRLAIPYLQPDRYFGVEPAADLVEAGFRHELGEDARRLKRPRFDHNADFRADVFGERFDFIIAQSVFSHTGEGPAARALASFAATLAPGGLILSNWLVGPETAGPPVATTDWAYPECVEFTPARVAALAVGAGLHARACPWPHPELRWFVMAREPGDLPPRDRLAALHLPFPAWADGGAGR
ncbi:MAG: class I SAM-dependent methyltransferase [Brevundimonas sp.]|uniref:class I SAM-dependent methyltransferase n=1 Tax=Brevundimonas sp. TaxID=1871086 RepID=UPI0017991859|nr:class I SAM-dependent methyltransferase [Brevundimonas sp.]MBA4803338.1 class I SAM-dependent methyltransferase [Brevundimonas sp.]